MKIISKESIVQERNDIFARGGSVSITENVPEVRSGSLKAIMGTSKIYHKQLNAGDRNIVDQASRVDLRRPIFLTGQYASGFDIPFGERGSIRERIARGSFSQNVPQNWMDLWDATRFDLTIRKEARPTVRQFFYNILSRPDITEIANLSELFPKAVIFERNNGQGEAVRQGSNLGGQKFLMYQELYAAGYMHTLWAALFDQSSELSQITDGVAIGYNAILDHNALNPIITADYGAAGTAKHTNGATSPGDNRQEKLYNAIADTLDDMSLRTDPITDRRIDPNGSVGLCSSWTARHIAQVLAGQLNTPADSKNLERIAELSRIVIYDGETIEDVNETVTYPGVPDGELYIIRPNRYMTIGQKRGLTLEVDLTPDVKRLAQEERAWYFIEGIYNALGIEHFVQKCTLPGWT